MRSIGHQALRCVVSPLPCYLLTVRIKYNPQDPILELFSLCSSFIVRDQAPHSYKTTGKITDMYTLIFTHFVRKLGDKEFVTGKIRDSCMKKPGNGRIYSSRFCECYGLLGLTPHCSIRAYVSEEPAVCLFREEVFLT